MKRRSLFLVLAIFSAMTLSAAAQSASPGKTTQTNRETRTFSSFDLPARDVELMARGTIKFENVDLGDVLKLYQDVSGRSMIRSATLPNMAISFVNETALTRVEVLQTLDNVLAAQGVTMVYLGTKYVKAVPAAQAPSEAAPVIELAAEHLPESSSYLTYIVELKNYTPEEVIGALQPFAKMPNSIVAVRGSDVIVLRDYSINVRRMLQVLERIEKAPRTPEKKPQPSNKQ